MRDMYELKETLCKKLGEYADKELTSNSLDIIYKLSTSAKNVGKLLMMADEEQGESMARRRDSMGRYSREGSSGARGYSRGGYSRDGYSGDGYSGHGEDFAQRLGELMEEAPDERTRRELEQMMSRQGRN